MNLSKRGIVKQKKNYHCAVLGVNFLNFEPNFFFRHAQFCLLNLLTVFMVSRVTPHGMQVSKWYSKLKYNLVVLL